MWHVSHANSIPFVSALIYNNHMAIKIEGNRVIVITDTSVHHVTKKDSSIKDNQIGECSICGDVLLIYMTANNNKEWYSCSKATRKSRTKYRRKKIENEIKKNDKYLSVV